MKKVKFMVATLLLIGATACNDKADEPTYTPTNEDAARILEESLAHSSGGMSDEIGVLGGALDAKSGEIILECGVPFDTTFTYVLSGNATGSWTRNWNLLMHCPAGENASLDVNTTYNGNFDGSFRSLEREGSRNWVWSEIGPLGDLRFMNGTGAHSGNRYFNENQENIFSWDYEAEWTTVAISKETNQIDSGSGVFTLIMTGPQGNSFTFDGSVVFNGEQSATVTVNGEVYEVNLG
ncbi:MAG TPA: hypothetical protein VJ949_09020 [Cryomorphaceae bacterium]|nr:hypothetical protein [Cryomorphaceae bacterium]